jgi:hypothetical protein
VASSALACPADRNRGAPPGNQLDRQPVQSADRPSPGAGELVATVGQQPQRNQLVVDADLV